MIYIVTYFLAVIGALFPQQLTITISGIKDVQGSIMVAVYNSEEDFLTTRTIASDQFKVEGNIIEGQIYLPFGLYGISVFHDINSDGVLNTGMFGIPKEPVGFSNNARGSFGPPKFGDVSFNFKEKAQRLKIELN